MGVPAFSNAVLTMGKMAIDQLIPKDPGVRESASTKGSMPDLTKWI